MTVTKRKDALLALELSLVQAILLKETKSGDGRFDQMVHEWLSQRGKMLRPAFYLLSSRFSLDKDTLNQWQQMAEQNPDQLERLLQANEKQMKFYKGAAAIELIHMASLIHDDVIDEAKLRRGKPTVQSRMGKDYAVYMGDYFFCRAVLLVADHEEKDSLGAMAKAMTQVCLGEIRQYHSRHLLQPDLRNYFKIIAGKTAALFALSFYAGGLEAGLGRKHASDLGKVGYNMGMAFQIIDDLLDYEPNQAIGKDTYKDLLQGNINLPIHLGLASEKGNVLSEMLAAGLQEGGIERIIELLKTVKADEKTAAYAQKFTNRALKILNRLPEHPAKEAIRTDLQVLLKREI